jgi:hypothetical protein
VAFAAKIAPKYLVPIHSSNWDDLDAGFDTVTQLRDGEACEIA